MHASTHPIPVAVVGVSGYTGRELVRILAHHPGVQIVGAFGSESAASGRTIADEHASLRGMDLAIEPASASAIIASGAQAVFLATPHEASAELAPELVERGLVVLDLSGAFRVPNAALYPEWYSFEHACPGLLDDAVYALVEHARGSIAETDLLSIPGCYPTAALLSLKPLIDAGLIDTGSPIVATGISAVSGAGRGAKRDNLFCDVSLKPYSLIAHRHAPEIAHHLGIGLSGLSFLPHVGPWERGLVVTSHAMLAGSVGESAVRETLEGAYAGEPFVRVLGAGAWPSVGAVAGSNCCDIGVRVDGGRVVVSGAIDNLVKGASGQAVQAFNVRFGFDETTALKSGLAGSAMGVLQ